MRVPDGAQGFERCVLNDLKAARELVAYGWTPRAEARDKFASFDAAIAKLESELGMTRCRRADR